MSNDYLDLQAVPPPPDMKADLMSPDTLGPTIVIVSAISVSVMLGFIFIRYYTKAYILRKRTWDDRGYPSNLSYMNPADQLYSHLPHCSGA